MLRTLTAVALVAALALPVASQAADSKLIKLANARMKTTEAVARCVTIDACGFAVGHDVEVETAILRRTNVLIMLGHSDRCAAARRTFVAAGDKAYRAGTSFVNGGGAKALYAYYYAARQMNALLKPLVAAC